MTSDISCGQASAALGGDLGGHCWGHRPTAAPQLMQAAKQWPPHALAL